MATGPELGGTAAPPRGFSASVDLWPRGSRQQEQHKGLEAGLPTWVSKPRLLLFLVITYEPKS